MSGMQGWRELIHRVASAIADRFRADDATQRVQGTDEAAPASPETGDAQATQSGARTSRQWALEGARADNSIRIVFAKALAACPVVLGFAWYAGGLPAAVCSLIGFSLVAALFLLVGRRIRLARISSDLSGSEDDREPPADR